jgi:hypothetical protein
MDTSANDKKFIDRKDIVMLRLRNTCCLMALRWTVDDPNPILAFSPTLDFRGYLIARRVGDTATHHLPLLPSSYPDVLGWAIIATGLQKYLATSQPPVPKRAKLVLTVAGATVGWAARRGSGSVRANSVTAMQPAL